MKPASEAEYRDFVAARFDQLGRFAFLLCRDWHRAEDTVQKALTKLYLHWNKSSLRSPDAYVRRIISNELISESRRMWFRKEQPQEQLPESAAVDATERHIQRISMMDALSQLPKRQRLAVVLRIWEDTSVEDTAKIMRCSPGTVKSQTARGLKTLRELLTDETTKTRKGALA